MTDAMIANQGSLLTSSNLFWKKHGINQERIRGLLDAQELLVG